MRLSIAKILIDVRLFRCDDYDNYDGGLLRMRNHA